MDNTKFLSDIELLSALCSEFGPRGYEDDVTSAIIAQTGNAADAYCYDKVGNLIIKFCGHGIGYNAENPRKLMITAKTDEIGLMIRKISDDGYLYFQLIGNIDLRVICGKRVKIRGNNGYVTGVIASKAIHLQTKDERTKTVPVNKLYVDIGARDKADAEAVVSVGNWAVFDSDMYTFGDGDCRIKGKSIGTRAGCAAIIEIIRILHDENITLPFDIYFVFARTGANILPRTVNPSYVISLGTSVSYDLPGVPEHMKGCRLGGGVVIPFCDRDVIFDRPFIDFAMTTAETNNIPAAYCTLFNGAGDAGQTQRCAGGIRMLELDIPVRNPDTSVPVICPDDYRAVRGLLISMLKSWKMN